MKKSTVSTILTCLSGIGVVATTVLAIRATPKAVRLIEEEVSGYDENGVCGTPLTKLETVKLCWKCYIPTIAVGVSTITCIFGANMLNKRGQAALMSAYALMDSSYKGYKKKVKELYGDDADTQVKNEIAKDNYEERAEPEDENAELFFDFATLQYFRAPMSEVLQKVTMDDGMECYIIATPFESAGYFE